MKAAAREEALQKRELLNEEECIRTSRRVIERLKEQPEFQNAKTILCYVSFRREVYTHELIEELIEQKEKRVCVPLSNFPKKLIFPREITNFEADLEEGNFGILEPKANTKEIPLEEIDLVLAPGVAFDTCGNRLGYGGGFYDRFLEQIPNTPAIALAFELQMIEQTHCEAHDCLVDKIVTEKRVIRCKKHQS